MVQIAERTGFTLMVGNRPGDTEDLHGNILDARGEEIIGEKRVRARAIHIVGLSSFGIQSLVPTAVRPARKGRSVCS